MKMPGTRPVLRGLGSIAMVLMAATMAGAHPFYSVTDFGPAPLG